MGKRARVRVILCCVAFMRRCDLYCLLFTLRITVNLIINGHYSQPHKSHQSNPYKFPNPNPKTVQLSFPPLLSPKIACLQTCAPWMQIKTKEGSLVERDSRIPKRSIFTSIESGWEERRASIQADELIYILPCLDYITNLYKPITT